MIERIKYKNLFKSLAQNLKQRGCLKKYLFILLIYSLVSAFEQFFENSTRCKKQNSTPVSVDKESNEELIKGVRG